MKVSKIPGLGRFGVFIDDVDFANLSYDEWMEIGKIHLQSLVTIVRNVEMTPVQYRNRMLKWGYPRMLMDYHLNKKYNERKDTWHRDAIVGTMLPHIDDVDKSYLENVGNMVLYEKNESTALLKVTGKKDADGNPLGMFAEGELLWHSNESGNLTFTPAVSLYGQEGMVGSATGFMTTTDWYEKQSESFRSELDEMVILHKFTPGKINPGLRPEQDEFMFRNMCPVDGVEIPLVINSPGGITGLHYSVNTIDRIKGMSQEESDKMLARITKELFVEEYMYDHWYKNDNDLCLFDNSITQHRRLGGIENRMALRFQYDYDDILDKPYMPYRQEPYISQYKEQITDIVDVMNLPKYKLPK